MGDISACFSSDSQEWETPDELFAALSKDLGPFDLDAAASEYNHKCEAYYDKNTDALSQPIWNGTRIWLNPPYGRDLGRWVEHAWRQCYQHGKRVVLLLPVRTDTRWWHRWIDDPEDSHRYLTFVRFLRGRVKFKGAASSAPFPSMVVIFDGLAISEVAA